MHGRVPRAADSPIRGNRPLAPVARGVGRLVDGQRQIAEEFGLPYERVFSDGFEAFKGHDAEAVVAAWLADPARHAAELETLFTDLVDHHFALFQALEAVAEPPARCTPVRRVLARFLRRGRASEVPPIASLAASYARSREAVSDRKQDEGTPS